MTTRSYRKSNAPSMNTKDLDKPDDSSDVTTPTGIETDKIENKMVTKVLKFSFVTKQQQTKPVHPGAIHTHWLHAIQTALGDEVIIWNNKGEKVGPLNLIQWTSNPTIHQKQFTIHQKITGGNGPRRNVRHFIVHRIITTASISTIKNIPAIHQILRDNSCYLHEHNWNEDDWDTTKIGFITKLDPNFYNPDQAHMKFTDYLKERIKKIQGRTKIKIPQFRMVFSSPRIRNDKNQVISTKAYAIEVKQNDSTLMLQILKSLIRDKPVFVPFSMRNKYPEGFTQAVKYQTQLLTSYMVIVLQYIHPDMMFHIDEFIKSIDGVIEIMPDKNVINSGKYRVQVSQDKFKTARESLINYLPKWCEEYIPIDAYPNPNPYPDSPKVQPIHNDGFSSGENSWMSMSNTSFLSMDLSNVADDDYFSNTTVATKAFTYAEIVLPTNLNTQASTKKDSISPSDDNTKAAISEITTTAKTDSIYAQQLKELENARAIIEKQKMEIQTLKDEHAKSDEKYNNILSMMNDRMQEQESEASTMKQEIAEMIIKQQNSHATEMQALYDRMMQQMTNMFSPPKQPFVYQSPGPPTQEHTITNNDTMDNTSTEYQDNKRQDTRPSPVKRKPTTVPTTTDQSPATTNISHDILMEVERKSPIIEDDV